MDQTKIELGIDSFVIAASRNPAEQMRDLLAEIELADRVGLDAYGIGEHHRKEFFDSAPAVILAAAAARTQRIRLTSAVTVLGANDPVRVFQEFATLDLLSEGRAEIIVGRGSSVEAFPLFGYSLEDYDALFIEKLELLLKLRETAHVHWTGRFRPSLTGQGVYPRPVQTMLPIRIGVGGTPASFERAGRMGLPLTVAIIGGSHARFRPLVDLYRRAGAEAGHPAERLTVGVHSLGYVADTDQQAADEFFPGYLKMIRELGRERGWSPPSRAQFNQLIGPGGPLLVGGPAQIAEKIAWIDDVLGGISRINFQMGVSMLPHEKMMRATELLGTRVRPLLRASAAV